MRYIILVLAVMWCSVGYGHECEYEHEHYKDDTTNVIFRVIPSNEALMKQIDKLKVQVEELQKMVKEMKKADDFSTMSDSWAIWPSESKSRKLINPSQK